LIEPFVRTPGRVWYLHLLPFTVPVLSFFVLGFIFLLPALALRIFFGQEPERTLSADTTRREILPVAVLSDASPGGNDPMGFHASCALIMN
jgi:hypothetical protein